MPEYLFVSLPVCKNPNHGPGAIQTQTSKAGSVWRSDDLKLANGKTIQ